MATNLNLNIFKIHHVIIFLVLLFSRCTSGEIQTLKTKPDDPFVNSVVESEIFTINNNETQIVEGSKGTLIMFQKQCFLDEDGKVVKGSVQIELAEALSLKDMLLSNLTTTSNGKLLETDGMIYWNATANDQQLSVNPDKPVYIEIPTSNKKPGMMAYRGERDADGNMNWVDPQELENYVVPVNLQELDFLPAGFQDAVAAGLPFRKHNSLNKHLLDSLYYSLSVYDLPPSYKKVITDLNEPYYNPLTQAEEGSYTKESFNTTGEKFDMNTSYGALSDTALPPIGIDPAIIKTLKSGKFQNTLISTREFETRLQSIFKTCKNEMVEL